MADPGQTPGASPAGDDDFGALVGWESDDLGDRIVLRLQSVRSAHRRAGGGARSFSYFLTKSQAAVLGNYLFRVAGQTPPAPRRQGWWRRFFR